jgi:hypothetical protein
MFSHVHAPSWSVATLTSNERVTRWRSHWPGVIVQTAPDPAGARERLETGRRHLAQADQLLHLGFPDVALLLAEAALVNGADSVLRLHGFNVQSHAARFAYPWLPFAYTGNPGLLARIRTTRNATQYEAAIVSMEFACEALRLARGALTAVAGTVT